MPYIKKERRDKIIVDDCLDYMSIVFSENMTAGELNFIITKVITNYLDNKGLSYTTINTILGALEGAKQEFYRRVAVPYEDNKVERNGDVYDV